jgi:hypothetical protein
MKPVGFEPTISAGDRPQTYAIDGAATGTGYLAPLGNANTVPLSLNPFLAMMLNEMISSWLPS